MNKLIAVLLVAMLCTSFVHADTISTGYSITINAASRTLKLYKDDTLVKEFPVAVGKPTTKSPIGDFKIVNKVINPWWNNNGNPVAPGPKNPLGIRWMGLSAPRGRYGIHGNSVPASISTFASGGCIRMFNSDVSQLFSIVSVGTPVKLVYENVELKIDKYTNTPVLIVYPDVYKKKTTEALLKKLRANNASITEQQAERALKLASESPTSVAAASDGTAVFFNNQYLTNDAFFENNQAYIYYLAAMEGLGLDAEAINSLEIRTIEKNNRVYINLTDAAVKIGGSIKYEKSTDNIFFDASIIKINGKLLSRYDGDFDKEYSFDQGMLQAVEGNIIPAAASKQSVSLMDYTKQKGWGLTVDSLFKIITIDIPLRVKSGDNYLNTVLWNDRHYIKCEDSGLIPEITNQTFNLYEYNNVKYIDLYELMEVYEYKSDSFFTVVDLIKPLVLEDINSNLDTNSNNTVQ